ncbi:MAG: hypothetical protein ACKVP7_08785 [Hyphomicrobiaceae bacterium]
MTFRASAATAAMLLTLCLSVQSACAVTITNRDDKDHKLTIIEEDGAKKSDHVLKANQVLENLCAKGCVIRLNDSEEDEYELEGNEAVSIEEGYLYYDTPEPPAETPPGATPPAGTPPAAPPAKK